MWRVILFNALTQITVLTVILFLGPELFGVQSSIGRSREDFNN